jgi:hypothetical protein
MASIVNAKQPASEKIHYEDRRRVPSQPAYGAGNRMMRQGASDSYDPATGRSKSSIDEESSSQHIFANNHASGDGRQMSRAGDGCHERDARCTQISIPVAKRPLTQKR